MYPRTSDIAEILGRCLPSTRAFFEYWNGKRAGRRMPARRDLDPIEMKPWLSNIQLIDVTHNPRRMIYRLVGELDVTFRGYNPTGRPVEECCIGPTREESLRNYDIVIDRGVPVFDWSDYQSRSGHLRTREELLLPLSVDAAVVNMVITFAEVAAGA